MNGWIKLFRTMLDWEWFTDGPVLRLFVYVLLKANTEQTSYRGIEIPRGSFNASEEKISLETGLSRQQVRTALKKLISTKEITKKVTNGNTIITVQKYNEYQSPNDYCNQGITTIATSPITSGITTTATTLIKNKKRRREEDKNKPPFIPPRVEEVREYCQSRRNGIDAEEFVDFYQSKNWMVGKNKMADWKACIRTWERKRPKPQVTKEIIYEQPW